MFKSVDMFKGFQRFVFSNLGRFHAISTHAALPTVADPAGPSPKTGDALVLPVAKLSGDTRHGF